MGVTGSIDSSWFIRTELGILSNSTFLDLQNYSTSNTNAPSVNILGRHNSNYIYFAFLPEYRFTKLKFLYVNAGIGFYSTITNEFDPISNYYNLVDTDKRAFVFNFGFNPRRENVGLIINLGYHNLANSNNQNSPNFSFQQLSVKVGVSYSVK